MLWCFEFHSNFQTLHTQNIRNVNCRLDSIYIHVIRKFVRPIYLFILRNLVASDLFEINRQYSYNKNISEHTCIMFYI